MKYLSIYVETKIVMTFTQPSSGNYLQMCGELVYGIIKNIVGKYKISNLIF
jgi:hypothetical protein